MTAQAEPEAVYQFLIELPTYVQKLANVIDNAELFDPYYVARCFEAMRMAQRKIDQYQSPTLGPN